MYREEYRTLNFAEIGTLIKMLVKELVRDLPNVSEETLTEFAIRTDPERGNQALQLFRYLNMAQLLFNLYDDENRGICLLDEIRSGSETSCSTSLGT